MWNTARMLLAGAMGLAAVAAAAQTRLPDVMQEAAEARAGIKDEGDRSPWVFRQYGTVKGKGCTLYHFTPDSFMAIIGPQEKGIITDSTEEAIVLLSGPFIPPPKDGNFQYQRVTVKFDGVAMATVKAVLVPGDAGKGLGGALVLYSRTLEEGLMVVRDTQTLGIDIDGKPVFVMRWTDAARQVRKLRSCAAGA